MGRERARWWADETDSPPVPHVTVAKNDERRGPVVKSSFESPPVLETKRHSLAQRIIRLEEHIPEREPSLSATSDGPTQSLQRVPIKLQQPLSATSDGPTQSLQRVSIELHKHIPNLRPSFSATSGGQIAMKGKARLDVDVSPIPSPQPRVQKAGGGGGGGPNTR